MALRLATENDLDELMVMAMKFAENSNYTEFVEEDKVKDLILHLLSDPEAVIFLHENKGMLVAKVSTFIYGSCKLATEICWWVEPDARAKGIGAELMEAYEYWAGKMGCIMLSMSSLDDKLGKYYESTGYKLYERAYIKELSCQQ